MIVKRTINVEEIKRILCHPEIYDRITHDDCPPSNEFEPPLDQAEYIGGYVGGEIIALMVYHEKNKGLFCHPQVLPEFRLKYARQFTQMALAIGLSKNASIFAEIPDIYPKVVNFAKHFGFKVVEVIRNKHLKHGKLSDSIVLRCDHELCQ